MSKWPFTLKITTLAISFFIQAFTAPSSYASDNSLTSPLRVAVSANFSPVLTKLIPEFIRKHNINVDIISGSSGTLYQQIMHGAPYDVFLSADDVHPNKLQENNRIIKGSRQTYALGQLAFWSTKPVTLPVNNEANTDTNRIQVLINTINNTTRIAIANPNTAPYGNRAFETLQNLGLWQKVSNNIITGINVSQTFQQLRSGSVQSGFVALSQLHINNLQGITIPETLYTPIKQQLVILKSSKQISAATVFTEFLQSNAVQQNIAHYGYKIARSTLKQVEGNQQKASGE